MARRLEVSSGRAFYTYLGRYKMQILSVFFGNVNVQLDNWQPKLNKLEKSLSLWRSRSLSLLGKSLIINVLGFSKFTYLAKVLAIPSWVLTSINALSGLSIEDLG